MCLCVCSPCGLGSCLLPRAALLAGSKGARRVQGKQKSEINPRVGVSAGKGLKTRGKASRWLRLGRQH